MFEMGHLCPCLFLCRQCMAKFIPSPSSLLVNNAIYRRSDSFINVNLACLTLSRHSPPLHPDVKDPTIDPSGANSSNSENSKTASNTLPDSRFLQANGLYLSKRHIPFAHMQIFRHRTLRCEHSFLHNLSTIAVLPYPSADD